MYFSSFSFFSSVKRCLGHFDPCHFFQDKRKSRGETSFHFCSNFVFSPFRDDCFNSFVREGISAWLLEEILLFHLVYSAFTVSYVHSSS